MSLSRIDVIEEYISSLIQNKQENEFVDFKQFYYHEDKKYDLIKDIVSFSNEVTSVDKYIVFGIINGSWEPVGIDLFTIPDVSVINDLLHTYVEPFIYVEIGQMKYNGKNLGYIKIPVDRADRPYVIKKEYSNNRKLCGSNSEETCQRRIQSIGYYSRCSAFQNWHCEVYLDRSFA